eukprot:Nk52_evm46s242 gene=Nk52_evmTU46s242
MDLPSFRPKGTSSSTLGGSASHDLDDAIGNVLNFDSTDPGRRRGQSKKKKSSLKKKSSKSKEFLADDFYAGLAESAGALDGGDSGGEEEEVDPQEALRIASSLDGMDDLDANLFSSTTSSSKKKKRQPGAMNFAPSSGFNSNQETTSTFSRGRGGKGFRGRVESDSELGNATDGTSYASSADNLDSALGGSYNEVSSAAGSSLGGSRVGFGGGGGESVSSLVGDASTGGRLRGGSLRSSSKKNDQLQQTFSDEDLDDLLDSFDGSPRVKKNGKGSKVVAGFDDDSNNNDDGAQEDRSLDDNVLGESRGDATTAKPKKSHKLEDDHEVFNDSLEEDVQEAKGDHLAASGKRNDAGSESFEGDRMKSGGRRANMSNNNSLNSSALNNSSLNSSKMNADFDDDDDDDILGALGLNDSAVKDRKPSSDEAPHTQVTSSKSDTGLSVQEEADGGGYELSGIVKYSADSAAEGSGKKTFSLPKRNRSGRRPIMASPTSPAPLAKQNSDNRETFGSNSSIHSSHLGNMLGSGGGVADSMDSLNSMPSEHVAPGLGEDPVGESAAGSGRSSRTSTRPSSRYGSLNNVHRSPSNNPGNILAVSDSSNAPIVSSEGSASKGEKNAASEALRISAAESATTSTENLSQKKFPWELPKPKPTHQNEEQPLATTSGNINTTETAGHGASSSSDMEPSISQEPKVNVEGLREDRKEDIKNEENAVVDEHTHVESSDRGPTLQKENALMNENISPFSPIFPSDKRTTRPELLAKIETLNEEIVSLSSQKASLEDSIRQYQMTEETLRSENASLKMSLEKTKVSVENELILSEVTKQKEDLSTKLVEMESELKRSKESLSKAVVEREHGARLIADLQNEVSKLNSVNRDMNVTEQSKIALMEKEHKIALDGLRSQYAKEMADVESKGGGLLEENKRFYESRLLELGKLRDEAIETLRADHATITKNQREFYEKQLGELRQSANATESMQSLIASVRSSTQEVGMLQQLVENEHKATISEREASIKEKEAQLELFRQELLQKQTNLDKEREKMQNLFANMNSNKESQNIELNNEYESIQAQKRELRKQEQALESDRQSHLQLLAQERKEVQQERNSLLREREELMSQSTLLNNSQRSILEKEERGTSKVLMAQADVDLAVSELERQNTELQAKAAALEKESRAISGERRELIREMEEFANEKQALTDLAVAVHEQSQALKESHQHLATERQELVRAKSTIESIQNEVLRKEKELETRTALLNDLEKRLARERLEIAKSRRDLMHSSVVYDSASGGNYMVLPEHSGLAPHSTSFGVPSAGPYYNGSNYIYGQYGVSPVNVASHRAPYYASSEGNRSMQFRKSMHERNINAATTGPSSFSTPPSYQQQSRYSARQYNGFQDSQGAVNSSTYAGPGCSTGGLNTSQLSPLYQKLKEVSELIHKDNLAIHDQSRFLSQLPPPLVEPSGDAMGPSGGERDVVGGLVGGGDGGNIHSGMERIPSGSSNGHIHTGAPGSHSPAIAIHEITSSE